MNSTIYNIIIILIIIYNIYVIIYEKRSIKSNLIEKGVKLSMYKTIISSELVYEKYLEKMKNIEERDYVLPKYKFKNKVEILKYLDMSYVVINRNDLNKKIFYLHGGSYIENPLIFHYKFLDEIATKSNLEIILPIYPKAIKYDYKYSYDKVISLYDKLFNLNNNVIIMGDSAGGGFALALSMLIKKTNRLKPSNIILLSPWLDITMQNRQINKYEKDDPFLSKKALVKAGILWSGNSDKSSYLLSPINGDFKNIGKITIFVGTHELFLPDARKLKSKLKKNKISFNYYEYKKMNHVFVMFPIKEANDAKNKILDIIKE